MTIFWHTVLVCNRPLRPTQPPILSGTGQGTVRCGREGNRGSDVALSMCQRLCDYVHLRVQWLKGDENPAYTPEEAWHPLTFIPKGGAVTQRVERWTCDQQVMCSNPTRGKLSCVTTLGKLFTPMCLCHQAVLLGTGQGAVMLCGWVGNRRPGGK